MGNLLGHIVTAGVWAAARASGTYAPPSLAAEGRGIYLAPSLETEGFIHLSTEEQRRATQARYYPGHSGLVLLRIDPVRLFSEVRYEAAHGELFPHLYGPLNLEAIVSIVDLPAS